MTDNNKAGFGWILAAGGAVILASTCCLGPLVLLALGLSGAWVSNLTLLEPYRPLLLGATLISVSFAYHKIFQSRPQCESGQVCASAHGKRTYKVVFWLVVAAMGALLLFPYVSLASTDRKSPSCCPLQAADTRSTSNALTLTPRNANCPSCP